MHGSSKASFPEILPRCVIPWENWSDNLRSVLPSRVPSYLVDYLFAKWEGFEVRTKVRVPPVPPSLLTRLIIYFCGGIDAIICSPLMTCSCTRHSLDWAAVSPTVFWPFRAPLGSKTKGTTFGNHRAGSYTIRPLFIWCERKCITFERR